MNQFSQAVCEKIGYYVYILKDPRTSDIFYIGKGCDNRVFQHVAGAINTPLISDKLNIIRDIHENGFNVEHYILRHGLTKEQSLEIESACIDLLGLNILTNIVKGHNSWDRGLKTVSEVAQYYDAKIISISEETIIININKLFGQNRFMTAELLYETTRSSWKIGIKREKAKYAIAAYRGLVREVYSIDSWHPKGNRWEFTGEIAESSVRDKYLNQSLAKYVKRGSQNPIKYTY